MELLLANHSSYPISDGSVRERREAIDIAIHEQEAAGLDIVTDGRAPWADLFAHIIGGLDGTALGDGMRCADSGQFYRQPVIVGAVRRRGPLLLEEFSIASRAAGCRVKAVLPGPYTMARLARIESGPYRDVPGLARALGDLWADEVADLAGAGASLIQMDEPAILQHPEDIRLLRQIMEPIWEARGGAQIILATHGKGAAALYAQLESVCADILAFDIVDSADLVDVMAATGSGKQLALGVIDGRKSQLESAPLIASRVEKTLKRYGFDSLHLQPSCGLCGMSPAAARAKLGLLKDVAALLQGHEQGRCVNG